MSPKFFMWLFIYLAVVTTLLPPHRPFDDVIGVFDLVVAFFYWRQAYPKQKVKP